MAILYKDKAAFKSTDFMCSLKKEDTMTQEEMKALGEIIGQTVDEKLSEFEKKQEERFSALEAKFNSQDTDTTDTADTDDTADNADNADTGDTADNADTGMNLSDASNNDEGQAFAEIKKAVTEGISEAFAKHSPQTNRKTITDTDTVKRFEGDKTVMDMSAEIDKDSSKSAAQKWSAQLALWNEHKAEM
jgi:hypothetical protein